MLSFNEIDKLHLQAAQGWLELGNWREANEELENVTASLRAHPDVLRLRWQVYKLAGKWDGALEIGKTLARLEPDEEYGYLCWAAALHGLGKTYQAYQVLTAAMEKFPDFIAVPYRAACYACAPRRAWGREALAGQGD